MCPEVVAPFARWLDTLPDGEFEFVFAGFTPFRDALAGTRFAQRHVVEAPRALAGAVGRLALARWKTGDAGDPAAVDANYVRRSDAEIFGK